MYKIYRKGNYLKIQDTKTNEYFSEPIKNVEVTRSNVNETIYEIKGVERFKGMYIKLSDLVTESGAAYTESTWETFYTENTGNFNGGGTAPTTDTVTNNSSVPGATVGDALDTLKNTAGFEVISPIDLSSPAPTLPGIYIPTQAGTYPNYGGIVVDLTNKISRIVWDGFIFREQVVDVDVTNKADKTQLESKADLFTGKNKFDKSTAVDGIYMEPSGIQYSSASYGLSDYIPVVAGQSYVANSLFRFSTYFDDANNVVSGGLDTGTYFTVPSLATKVRISYYASKKAGYQIELGLVSTSFENYKKTILESQIDSTGKIEIGEKKLVHGDTVFKALVQKVELSTGKNIFNKAIITTNAYMGENGSQSASAVYSYSDFLKITAGGNYKANKSMRFTCYYDTNKVFLAGGSGSPSTSFVAPVNSAFVIVTINNSDINEFQLEKGTVSTSYALYKDKVVAPENLEIFSSQIIKDTEIGADTFKLFLPKEVCIAVGRTIELYNSQVSWCGNINDYSFVWSGVGKSLKRKWSCTGVTVGNSTLTLKVYNKNNILIATKTTTIKVASNIISIPFTICSIGDSLTNSKPWTGEISVLSDSKISFVGTRNFSTHEGRSGADASYYLGNNAYVYEMSGYNGNDGRSQTLNPFWSPITSDVNFNYYKSNYNQNPDKLIIWLGTNGIAVDPIANATNIKTFIDKIRATGGANIKIFVVHTLFRGNQNGIGVEEGTDGYVVTESYKLNEDLKVFNLQERLLADLGSYPNLYMIPISTCHDSEFNFGQVATPVNPRATQIELMPSQATHPQLQGYNQIADIIFSSLAVNL